jgi:hypothetical protein
VAASNVLHQLWVKDQLPSLLFTKYSKNRNFPIESTATIVEYLQ